METYDNESWAGSIRTTRDTNFDTHLSLYTGSDIASLTFQNSNNNVSLPNRTSVIIYYMTEGTSVYIRVSGQSENESFAEGAFNLDITPAVTRQSSDFDRDGKTDFSVFRPGDGTWYVSRSVHDNATVIYERWGLEGDVPVPADWPKPGTGDCIPFGRQSAKILVAPRASRRGFSCYRGWPIGQPRVLAWAWRTWPARSASPRPWRSCRSCPFRTGTPPPAPSFS